MKSGTWPSIQSVVIFIFEKSNDYHFYILALLYSQFVFCCIGASKKVAIFLSGNINLYFIYFKLYY